MATTRYLLYVSYIGTRFQGCQRQVAGRFPRLDDPSTVQGRLEMGLKILNPSNTPVAILSSRTDAGVHALSSTFHVDLHRSNSFVYEPKTITIAMNKYFTKEELPIRVIKTFLVPNEFHCRHNAISRTYLYKFAVIKSEALNMAPSLKHIPIEEMERCYFLCTDTFDVDVMRENAKFFLGVHDFRSFMGKGSKEPDKVTRRQINRLEILNSRPFTYSPFSWPSFTNTNFEDYQFYDVYISANGFLYRQVRRMVGSLIAVAQGKVSSSDIKLMLQIPSHRTWNDKIRTVPACGLYLCQVEYNLDDHSNFKD